MTSSEEKRARIIAAEAERSVNAPQPPFKRAKPKAKKAGAAPARSRWRFAERRDPMPDE